jgi:hypothetical protein
LALGKRRNPLSKIEDLFLFRRCFTEGSSLLVYLTFIFSSEVTSKRGPPAAQRTFSKAAFAFPSLRSALSPLACKGHLEKQAEMKSKNAQRQNQRREGEIVALKTKNFHPLHCFYPLAISSGLRFIRVVF